MFALLEHDTRNAASLVPAERGVHWDLVVEWPGQERLLTWRLVANPLALEADIPAQRIQDHRRIYLDYEGPVRGDRGVVRRLDRGAAVVERLEGDAWSVRFDGTRLSGLFEITRAQTGALVFRRVPRPCLDRRSAVGYNSGRGRPFCERRCTVPSDSYQQYLQRVREIQTATSVEGILEWDQETCLPAKGAQTRAAQLALIAGVGHERLTSDEFGRLLVQVEQENDSDPVVSTNVREMRRIYDRKIKLPTVLVQEIARTIALSKEAWVKARKESDFLHFAPHLEKLLDLKRQVAEKVGYTSEPYDALLDEFEPGARAADVQKVFHELKREQVPLVQAMVGAPRQPNRSLLERACSPEQQAALGRRIAAEMGFDFEAGRLDTSTHPFCSGMSPLDVRMTTRYDEHYLPMSLFGIMHEAGHGLYEQGLEFAHAGTPMGMSVSLGIHESQSRMWENLVGRSRPFWQHYFAPLQAAFPSLRDVSLDDWYFAINTVRPSLIRVEADEVTYNLHIMLRFDLERQMIAGKLKIKDIPAAWNDGMKQSLGITPPSDAEGCLQDIHWSMGIFGYFPTYALGNLYAAQFFGAALKALPELNGQIARGELRPLRQWLRSNIHCHGQRYRAGELVKIVTGQPLSHGPYIAYLTSKFKPLYGF